MDLLVVVTTLVLAIPAVARSTHDGKLGVSLAVLPFATLPLFWRRTRPGVTLVVLLGALVAAAMVGKAAPGNVGVLFGLYAAARYGNELVRAASGALAGTATVTALAWVMLTDRTKFSPHVTVVVLGAGAAWVLGEATRTRRAYLGELEDRAIRLVRERDEHARRAAELERIRIARELHDIVTHSVTVIAIQAAAAGSASRPTLQRAREALGLIESTARTTLQELRSLLGVLRAADGQLTPAPRAPTPTIFEPELLIEQTRRAGVEVAFEVTGEPVALGALAQLVAYRVLQEALTNVAKHAPSARAEVLLCFAPRGLEITVADEARGAANTHGLRPGAGLNGMRERLEIVGGTLEAGPDVRGYRLRVFIPPAAPTAEDRDARRPLSVDAREIASAG